MHRRTFTEEETKFILDNWNKLSIHKIREIVNCSKKALELFAEQYNLEISESNRWTIEEIEVLKELSSIMPIEEIALKFNKSEKAIYQKGKRLGLLFEQNRRLWTNEEEIELRRNWGTISLESISKKLNRSIYSIKVKAIRMGLGPMFGNNPEWLTMNDISELMHITRDKVEYWSKHGLEFKRKKLTRKYYYYGIMWEDFLNFLMTHQDEWDSRKLELNIFGEEFDWLSEKRKKDQETEHKEYRKWTQDEIDYVEYLFKQGMNYKEIAKVLKRPESSISTILRELGYSYRLPQFWKGKELLFLKNHYEDMSYEEIGKSIGRTTRAVQSKARQLGYKKRTK